MEKKKSIKERTVIVLNPGHAPNTPGKCSPDGTLREWEWNRCCATVTADVLRGQGYRVILAVAEDEKISLTAPVQQANAMCRTYGKENVLFISIHCNAAGNGKEWKSARGWSIWTTEGQTKSDRLATCIYHGAEQAFRGHLIRKDMQDGDVDYESNFYVLRKTLCPAVLIEHFFMDNKEDCAFLKTDNSKRLAAAAILAGVEEYLSEH